MKQRHLYVLVVILLVAGISAIVYKWKVLNFPLQPQVETEVWTMQARVEYQPRRGPNTVQLQIPKRPPGFAVLDERFIASNYSQLEEEHGSAREVQWSTRRARGAQVLYYRATVVRSTENPELGGKPRVGDPPILEEPHATAAQAVLDLFAHVGVDVAPILEDPGQHRFPDAFRDVSDHIVHQTISAFVVENVAHQGAGLTPVVVVCSEGVGAAHHVAVCHPVSLA